MDWIHCNKCLLIPVAGTKILLTNCGHMLCEDCSASNAVVCAVCGKSCRTTFLSANMDPSVKPYFTSTEDILKNALEVLNFQSRNRKELFDHLYKLTVKHKALKQDASRLFEKYKKMEAQFKECLKENASMKKKIRVYELNLSPKTPIMSSVPQASPYFCAQPRSQSSVKSSNSYSKIPFQNTFQLQTPPHMTQQRTSGGSPQQRSPGNSQQRMSPGSSSAMSSSCESDAYLSSPVPVRRSTPFSNYRLVSEHSPGTPPSPNLSEGSSPGFTTAPTNTAQKIGTSPAEQALRNLTFDHRFQMQNRKH